MVQVLWTDSVRRNLSYESQNPTCMDPTDNNGFSRTNDCPGSGGGTTPGLVDDNNDQQAIFVVRKDDQSPWQMWIGQKPFLSLKTLKK